MTLTNEIINVYNANKNPENAKSMSAYMRGQFAYFGIKTPLRREISKPFLKEAKSWPKKDALALIRVLYEQPQRECHHLAQEIFEKGAKKWLTDEKDIDFLEWMVLTNSWWDTVDFIAPRLMRIYFDKFPEKRKLKVDEWSASGNTWLQRSALLIHLKKRKDPDFDLMFDTILKLNNTDDFFVDKAIGWLLREYAKTYDQIVIEFVQKHKKCLSNLSVREALKHHSELIRKN